MWECRKCFAQLCEHGKQHGLRRRTRCTNLITVVLVGRFFGGGGFPGFGGFGGMGDEEEQTPKGHDVHVELEVTLKDLYLGHHYKASNSYEHCL